MKELYVLKYVNGQYLNWPSPISLGTLVDSKSDASMWNKKSAEEIRELRVDIRPKLELVKVLVDERFSNLGKLDFPEGFVLLVKVNLHWADPDFTGMNPYSTMFFTPRGKVDDTVEFIKHFMQQPYGGTYGCNVAFISATMCTEESWGEWKKWEEVYVYFPDEGDKADAELKEALLTLRGIR